MTKSLAEQMVTIDIPGVIRDSYISWKIAIQNLNEARAKYLAVNDSLNLTTGQQKELNHRIMEVASKQGYDSTKEYRYLKTYAFRIDTWGRRNTPYITMEWIEAQYTMDLRSAENDLARRDYDRFFQIPGFQDRMAEAYKTIVTMILDAEWEARTA